MLDGCSSGEVQNITVAMLDVVHAGIFFLCVYLTFFNVNLQKERSFLASLSTPHLLLLLSCSRCMVRKSQRKSAVSSFRATRSTTRYSVPQSLLSRNRLVGYGRSTCYACLDLLQSFSTDTPTTQTRRDWAQNAEEHFETHFDTPDERRCRVCAVLFLEVIVTRSCRTTRRERLWQYRCYIHLQEHRRRLGLVTVNGY